MGQIRGQKVMHPWRRQMTGQPWHMKTAQQH